VKSSLPSSKVSTCNFLLLPTADSPSTLPRPFALVPVDFREPFALVGDPLSSLPKRPCPMIIWFYFQLLFYDQVLCVRPGLRLQSASWSPLSTVTLGHIDGCNFLYHPHPAAYLPQGPGIKTHVARLSLSSDFIKPTLLGCFSWRCCPQY